MNISVAWTVDEGAIIISDENEDQPLITIRFHDPTWDKATKLAALDEVSRGVVDAVNANRPI